MNVWRTLVSALVALTVCACGSQLVRAEPPFPIRLPLLRSRPDQARPASHLAGQAQPSATVAATERHPEAEQKDLKIVSTMPILSLETIGPAEINVGKPTWYVFTVRNVGDVDAEEVQLHVQVPQSLELKQTTPEPDEQTDGKLIFNIGRMAAKSNKEVKLQVVPHERGQLEVAADVRFAISSRTTLQVRKPELVVKVEGPTEVLYGDQVELAVHITNTGDGPAEALQIVAKLPEQLDAEVQQVAALEFHPVDAIAVLQPNETRTIKLIATADKVGLVKTDVLVRAESEVEARGSAELVVRRPMLEAKLRGPRLRYTGRVGTYEVHLSNPGDAPASNVKVVAVLPPGLAVTAIEKRARFNKADNSVSWMIASLEPGATEVLKFQAKAVAPGDQVQQVTATAERGLIVQASHRTRVESIADVKLTVVDTVGPIEVNSEADYEVRIVNRGSEAATNVVVVATLPEGLEPLPGSDYRVDGNKVVFDTVGDIGPGETRVLKFKATSQKSGDYVVKVELNSESVNYPVVGQETTIFYDDESVEE